jgi:hypothetical protein
MSRKMTWKTLAPAGATGPKMTWTMTMTMMMRMRVAIRTQAEVMTQEVMRQQVARKGRAWQLSGTREAADLQALKLRRPRIEVSSAAAALCQGSEGGAWSLRLRRRG